MARMVAQSDECPAESPWGVTNGDEVEGCYASEEEAQSAADSADEEASGTVTEFAALPEGAVPFVGIATVLDYETSDGRCIASDGFVTRGLPLPLMYQDTNPAFGGHEGAVIAGQITEVEVVDRRVFMRGFLDAHATERSDSIVELVRNQTARFVSIDLTDADVEYEVREVDADGWPTDVLARMHNAEMGGATVTPFPAIPDAVIWLDGEVEPSEASAELPEASVPLPEEDRPEVAPELEVLFASASELPAAEDFADPRLPVLTPLTVMPDGRVFGHLAPWGECHIGLPGCVTAPPSPSDYAYFRTGAVLASCDCGEDGCSDEVEVPVGTLTVGAFHAGEALSATGTVAHYEHTGCAVADVAAGEDQFGVWLAGRVRSDATAEQVRLLRGAKPSGDWRRIGGALELVAVLAVNTPGFPVPRPRMHVAASAGRGLVQTALVGQYDPRSGGGNIAALAASAQRRVDHARIDQGAFVTVPRAEWEASQDRVARLEADLADLRPLVAEQIERRLGRA